MFCEIKSLEDFYALTQSNGIVTIHFWAEWNLYDITLRKILSELENDFEQEVKFGSLNVDQENLVDFLRSFPIINVPTLAYYKDGNKIAVEIGLRGKEYFQSKINLLLKS